MKGKYRILILIQAIIIVLTIAIFLFLNSNMISIIPKCIFREKFGIICPACYGTTFFIKMAKLNFIEAFKVHPVFFISIIYLMLLDAVYVINVIFKKNISIFRWWHLIVWLTILLIYTSIRNII